MSAANVAAPGNGTSPETAPSGASFYALGPEFEWLAAAWEGFARELAAVGSTLRHVVAATTADPQLAAESSGLAALESATDRLVRELVDDAARIRRTQATYEHADAAVHAAVPLVPSPPPVHVGLGSGSGPVSGSGSGSSFDCGPDSGSSSGDSAIPVFGAGIATGPAAAAAVGTRPAAIDPSLAAGGSYRPYTGAPEPADSEPSAASGPGGSASWHRAGAQNLSETALGTLSRFRRQILARAEHWVAQHVPYNQGAWHEGYRTDCAGYVSMCWGLRDSLVTSTMPQIAHRIAKDDLRAGDVLLNTNVTTGHVIIFDRWADYAHNSYVGYELCPRGTLHHVIPYPYYSGFGTYEPYRYNNAGD